MNEKEKVVKTASKAASSVKKKERELPFYIVKRGDAAKTFGRSLLIRGGAILIALLLCGIATIFVTGDNPLSIYATMFEGAFGNARNIWKTLQDMAILLCVSLAVTPAFKMRFWNTGAEGQVLISALATAMCMFYFGGSVPTPVLMLIMIAGSILAGVVWAVIPAIFKAFWGTNETLFTLMMNYVAIQLVACCVNIWRGQSSGLGKLNMRSKAGWFPQVFGQRYNINLIVVVLLVVLMYCYLRYSKQGYEIAVVGESENTARYAGINVGRVIIRTMIISGALCGLTGF
ncbi:MAG: ABC transporter permease, partial [Clostridia bacterium]|nr:ABC transporter permease [Clostridia bacterium]